MGHLSTRYWIGLKPGDVHWNISSPGWAKHAWSCFFAPWNAGATIFIYNYYVGRSDDVFKASDYRISPFELESVLIEHEAVAEAAVIPSPDPIGLAVPKAILVLRAGFLPSPELAQSILAFARSRLASYKRIRIVEFGELPKTLSGKIRRVELRRRENARQPGEVWPMEFREPDQAE